MRKCVVSECVCESYPNAYRLTRAQALEEELARLRKQLSETEEHVQSLKRALTAKEQEKKMAVDALNADVKAARAHAADLQRQLDAAAQTQETLRADVARLQASVVEQEQELSRRGACDCCVSVA